MKKAFLILVCVFAQGCSNPFGAGSLIDGISDGITDGIADLFGKTSSDFVAGGANKFETASSYKGSISVGNYVNQEQQTTNGGYRVITTIK